MANVSAILYNLSEAECSSGESYEKMYYNNRRTGSRYEAMAGAYLEKLGYEILEYNFRCRIGEIDLIAKDGSYLVFCEVKFRSGREHGYPEEAVTPWKQRIIAKCAGFYLLVNGLDEVPCRFDVISIEGQTVTHYIDAFDAF